MWLFSVVLSLGKIFTFLNRDYAYNVIIVNAFSFKPNRHGLKLANAPQQSNNPRAVEINNPSVP